MLPILRSVISRRSFSKAATTDREALTKLKLEKMAELREAFKDAYRNSRYKRLLVFPVPVMFGYGTYAVWKLMDTVEYFGVLLAYREEQKKKRAEKVLKRSRSRSRSRSSMGDPVSSKN